MNNQSLDRVRETKEHIRKKLLGIPTDYQVSDMEVKGFLLPGFYADRLVDHIYSELQNLRQELASDIEGLKTKKGMILYTDTIQGKQTLRDDLWAVSTEDLDKVLAIIKGEK